MSVRLQNVITGVTVSVEEDTAANLDSHMWKPEGEVAGDSEADLPEGEPDTSWKVAQLKAYAEANSVDLDGVTKKEEILAAITAANTAE